MSNIMATPSSGSIWNPANIQDVAESVGVNSLAPNALDYLTRDVEFRLAQVLEEALKHMRHSKRTTLHTTDVTLALRTLEVEPLYGYESTRPLKFGETSIGPGQPLFYLEDEEVDFEKLINAPLPKVPREITFTAHWLAIEGVQPTIPQNPTQVDAARGDNLLPKGPGTNPHLAATAGSDNLSVKPLVKHILSKELQLYFEHVTSAVLDESNPEYRAAALSSLRDDPGLHQLVPYFVQYVAEKVTHNMKNLFVLGQMLHLIASLLSNPHLHVAPYVASLVPPVLTCLIGKRLGPAQTASSAAASNSAFLSTLTNGTAAAATTSAPNADQALPAHYPLRTLASSVLKSLTRPSFTEAIPTLKPRIGRSLLQKLLASTAQSLGTYYGALQGLCGIAGSEGVRTLVLPNLRAVNVSFQEVLDEGSEEVIGPEESESRRMEVAAIVEVVVGALRGLEEDENARPHGNDDSMQMSASSEQDKEALTERVGSLFAQRICEIGRPGLIRVALVGAGPNVG